MEVKDAAAQIARPLAGADQTLVVYWDGQCPFCGAIKERIEGFDTNHRLHFVDLNDPSIARTAEPRFSPAELREEMRAHMPNGTWRTGFYAWAAVSRALPLFRGIGWVMQLWIFADIGPKIYRWVAEHRYEISRILRLPAPCAADGACRIDQHQG